MVKIGLKSEVAKVIPGLVAGYRDDKGKIINKGLVTCTSPLEVTKEEAEKILVQHTAFEIVEKEEIGPVRSPGLKESTADQTVGSMGLIPKQPARRGRKPTKAGVPN